MKLARFASKKYGKNFKEVKRVDDTFPVGSIILRCKDGFFADFHFVRKVVIDGECCWISKPGLDRPDIWFDEDINLREWEGGYNSQMYLIY